MKPYGLQQKYRCACYGHVMQSQHTGLVGDRKRNRRPAKKACRAKSKAAIRLELKNQGDED